MLRPLCAQAGEGFCPYGTHPGASLGRRVLSGSFMTLLAHASGVDQLIIQIDVLLVLHKTMGWLGDILHF